MKVSDRIAIACAWLPQVLREDELRAKSVGSVSQPWIIDEQERLWRLALKRADACLGATRVEAPAHA